MFVYIFLAGVYLLTCVYEFVRVSSISNFIEIYSISGGSGLLLLLFTSGEEDS